MALECVEQIDPPAMLAGLLHLAFRFFLRLFRRVFLAFLLGIIFLTAFFAFLTADFAALATRPATDFLDFLAIILSVSVSIF